MRTVREDRAVEDALEAASDRWERTNDAWDTLLWVLARDPTVGVPISETGTARTLVYPGSWAHQMPTIKVLYEIDVGYVTIRAAEFSDAQTSAGRA